MKSKLLYLLFLLLFSHLTMAESTWEMSIHGGWSSWGYQVSESAKHTTSYSYGVQLGYAYFFTKHLGLGLGVDCHRTGDALTLSTTQSWIGVSDTDGETYNHQLTINRWKDQQQAYYLSLPLSVQLRFPTRVADIYIMAGASYDIALMGNTSATGSLTHTGDYPQWNMHVDDDVDAYGFYTTDSYKPTDKLKMNNTLSAFMRANVAFPINKRWYVFVGAIARYSLLTAYSKSDNLSYGFRDDSPIGAQTHPFMNAYVPLINTTLVSGTIHPLTIGLEVGVRYIFPHKNKYPCKCI